MNALLHEAGGNGHTPPSVQPESVADKLREHGESIAKQLEEAGNKAYADGEELKSRYFAAADDVRRSSNEQAVDMLNHLSKLEEIKVLSSTAN